MTSSSVPCSSLPDTGSSVATGAARAFAALAAFWLIVTIPASPASASGDTTTASPAATTATSRSGESAARSDQAAAIVGIAREKMAADHLKAVILRVTIDGQEVVTEALGESMTGVPATKDMHFRNGAVAISYVATLLLQLVDQKKVSLDDKVAKWLPDIPHADRVTLGQLAQMTSGYADYVPNPEFPKALYENPFRQWTPRELIAYGTSQPLVYEPGTNWNYAHTNYVILGLALEKITGKPMTTLLKENVLGPLNLRNTEDPQTAEIRQPVLHAFSSERREALGIPPSTRFYEESTYWNPSWTITHGAIQYTDIYDMTTTAEAIGTGQLLSPESHKAQVEPRLRGFGSPVEGCTSCFTQSIGYTYGIGVVLTGSWIMQNPMFGGYAAVEAYLPSKKIAIAVAVTFDEKAFDETGGYKNRADDLFRAIGAYLAPDDAPPVNSPTPVCAAQVCLRSAQYYALNLSGLPHGAVTVTGVSPFNQVSTGDAGRLRVLLRGGTGAAQKFNQQFVALQLSLLSASDPTRRAEQSNLLCYGINFQPVQLGTGFTLSPATTIGELLGQAREAARSGNVIDMRTIGRVMNLLNGDDPGGRCR